MCKFQSEIAEYTKFQEFTKFMKVRNKTVQNSFKEYIIENLQKIHLQLEHISFS